MDEEHAPAKPLLPAEKQRKAALGQGGRWGGLWMAQSGGMGYLGMKRYYVLFRVFVNTLSSALSGMYQPLRCYLPLPVNFPYVPALS